MGIVVFLFYIEGIFCFGCFLWPWIGPASFLFAGWFSNWVELVSQVEGLSFETLVFSFFSLFVFFCLLHSSFPMVSVASFLFVLWVGFVSVFNCCRIGWKRSNLICSGDLVIACCVRFFGGPFLRLLGSIVRFFFRLFYSGMWHQCSGSDRRRWNFGIWWGYQNQFSFSLEFFIGAHCILSVFF